jgi:hypothetical protein
MTLTPADIGFLLMLFSVAAFVGGVFPRLRVVAILVGVPVWALNGPASRFLGWAADLTGWAQAITTGLVGWGFGVVLPGLLAIGLAALVIFDLHPKGGRAARRTWFAALGLSVMIATASTNVAFLNNIGPQIAHGVQQAQTQSGG